MIWALLNAAGEVVAQVVGDTHPCDPRPGEDRHGNPIEIPAAYDWPRDRVIALDRKLDTALERWVDGAIVQDMAVLDARLCAAIDSERAARGAAALTAGESVKLAYSRKGEEARAYSAYTVEPDIPDQEKRAFWPWLMAEADISGDSLHLVAVRVLAGMQASEEKVRRIEAVATTAKRQIREAATAGEKRAIYRDIQWEPDNGGNAG